MFIYVPVICGLWHYFQPKSDEDYVARQLASMYYRGYLEHIASDICDQRFDDFERKNPWEKKFSVRAIHILLTRSCTFPKVPIVDSKEYWDEEWAKKFETKPKIKYVANIDTEVDMSVFPDPSNQLPNRIEQIVRFFKSCFVNTFSTFSERAMNRHWHRYRPNLEVRQGSAEPANLQVLSAKLRPNQFTK